MFVLALFSFVITPSAPKNRFGQRKKRYFFPELSSHDSVGRSLCLVFDDPRCVFGTTSEASIVSARAPFPFVVALSAQRTAEAFMWLSSTKV